jgi:hypothetical protein
MGDNHLRGGKPPQESDPGAVHRLDLHIDPLAAGPNGRLKQRRLPVNPTLELPTCFYSPAGGNGVWRMQAEEHLVKLVLEVLEILQVVQP